jgi:predicted outer membrane protein
MHRNIALALSAALLAGPAAAQSSWPPGPGPTTPPTTPAPAPPAPAPAPPSQQPAPPPAAPPAAQTPAPGTDPRLATLQQVQDLAAAEVDAGRIAQEKATTQAVRDLGRRMVEQNERILAETAAQAQRLGLPLGPTPAPDPGEAAAHARWRALQGIEFDRAFVQEIVSDHEQRVDQLKALRDRTEGRHAELKSWLDDVENRMESYRNETRQARAAVRDEVNRQGRAPPAR